MLRGVSPDKLIWDVLKIRVQTVTGEALSKSSFEGGLLIDEIRSGGPAENLRVGDIIVGLHAWQTKNNAELAWTLLQPISKNLTVEEPNSRRAQEAAILHYFRDGQAQTTRVVLPPWPPIAESSSATTTRSAAGADLSAARAIRDKLLQRWEATESLFKGGRVELRELIQAAKDLGEAELNSAADAQERIAAGQQLVERLKGVQSIVDAKYQGNVEPIQHKLAVDAEVLKAEAQVAAESRARLPGGTLPTATPPEVPSGRRDLRDLTAARAYRDKVRERVQLVERGHTAGTTPLLEVLRAKVELDDAEGAAAADAERRQAARQQKVEHLKEIKSLTERMHQSGQVQQTDLLAAEAELLKAEAESAAEVPAPGQPAAAPR